MSAQKCPECGAKARFSPVDGVGWFKHKKNCPMVVGRKWKRAPALALALLLTATAHAAPPSGSREEAIADCRLMAAPLGGFAGGEVYGGSAVNEGDDHRFFLYQHVSSKDSEDGFPPSVICLHAIEVQADGHTVIKPWRRRVFLTYYGQPVMLGENGWQEVTGGTVPPTPPVVPPTVVCP